MSDNTPREQQPGQPQTPASPVPPPAPQYGQQPPHGQPYGAQGQQPDPYAQQNPYAGQPNPYAQQNPYAAQNPYAQNPYAQNPYAQQNPYAAQPPAYGQQPSPYGQAPYPQQSYQPAEPVERSSTLGLAALVVVAVCTAIVVAAGWVFGTGMGQFFLDVGVTDPGALDQTDPRFIAFAEQLAPWSTAATFATMAGIAGWIMGIVAASQRRGRTFGIWAIILGILAPIAGLVAMMVAVWPAFQAIA